jgi:hypothetical protein
MGMIESLVDFHLAESTTQDLQVGSKYERSMECHAESASKCEMIPRELHQAVSDIKSRIDKTKITTVPSMTIWCDPHTVAWIQCKETLQNRTKKVKDWSKWHESRLKLINSFVSITVVI